MDIAVADESPLGRYLAEIDAAAGESLANELQNELHASLSSSRGPVPATTAMAAATASDATIQYRERTDPLLRAFRSMRANAERFVAHWLVDALSFFDDTLREELEESSRTQWQPRHWWVRQSGAFRLSNGCVHAILVGTCVALAATCGNLYMRSFDIEAATRSMVVRVPVALGLCGVLAMELLYQALLAFHRYKAQRLITAIRRFAASRQVFECSYQMSLDLVKKGELASRGYRIGLLLPPVGRIEKVTSLRCRQMRLRLRQINEQMERIAMRIQNREPVGCLASEPGRRRKTSAPGTADGPDGRNAPSLLITALAKRHELVSVLLESAFRESLFESVSPFWNLQEPVCQQQQQRESENTLVHALRTQTLQYVEVSRVFSVWSEELDRMNTSRDMTFLHSAPTVTGEDATSSNGAAPQSPCGNDADAECIREHLKELRTACETLKHLLFVAQCDTAALLGEQTVDPAAKQEWRSQSLAGTRGLMKNMVGALNTAWERYESALDAIHSDGDEVRGNANVGSEEQENGEVASGDGAESDVEARRKMAEDKLREEQEKRFTFVFTGTSTGEKDFDLNAMLKQQQVQQAAPIPSFVHELQDVLAHREAHAQPTITKQIDHDLKMKAIAADPSSRSDTTEGKGFRMRLQQKPSDEVLQSELQSLLLQRDRALSEEFFD